VLGWVAVLIAGIVLYFKTIPWLDPALSLAIATFILWNVFRNLKETTYIFLQAVPPHINLGEIKKKICNLPGVDSIHHTHLWSLEGKHHVFTSHVKLHPLQSIEEMSKIKKQVNEILVDFPFSHYTIEIELHDEKCLMDNNFQED